MKSKIILFMISFNKISMSYDLLSEHPERYSECSRYINGESSLEDQIKSLFMSYLDLSTEYIKFLHLSPYILDHELILPIYCLIPYNSYEFKNCYKIPCKQYVEAIPDLRKILNVI